MKDKKKHSFPRVLMVGYNGANNTGAEALLLSDIEDVRCILGPETKITVPTLNEKNLSRYLKENQHIRIVPISSVYFAALRRLVREHDLILLVEGSTYMDTWSSALLWAFLWTTRCAHALGKPCLAYAVDAGELSSSNQRRVERIASTTDLIITRSQAAMNRLRSYGVTAPIQVTADNALTFQVNSGDEGFLLKIWPEASQGIVGFAVVDFYLWPVVIRPWGYRHNCYRWPYYYSRDRERRQSSEKLARCYASLADGVIEKHGKSVALIAMEQLDEPLAQKIQGYMVHQQQARIFSSREYHASQMTILLRSLDLLVTSRYHASILSLAAQVPQIAVGHDLRLRSFYQELGLKNDFFIDHCSSNREELLVSRLEKLLAVPEEVREILHRGYQEHLAAAQRNRLLLREFIHGWGWKVQT
ncbi:MAG: polysaccharide pyruvyl transferase family protein [Candidatus Atribacteria bacterium]|nr:polysaccharide pyruvyl transferase family protein [Candidatus Atribacteria bacterium]